MAKQTMAGRIRQRIDEIEAQIHIGISQKDICEALNNEGHKIEYSYFRELVARARLLKNSKKITEKSDTTDVLDNHEAKPRGFVFNSKPKENDLI